MSIDAINSLSNAASAAYTNKSNNKPLTEETRKQLESLGIDTSKIKTEAEGQKKLKEASASQNSQAAQAGQSQQQQNAATQFDEITDKVQVLASQVGVSISKNENMSDILSKIADKISEMNSQAVNDPEKAKQVKEYSDALNEISNECQNLLSQEQTASNQFISGLDSLAMYNKLLHKL